MLTIIKLIFFLSCIPIVLSSILMAGYVFKEAGWSAPWRWLCLICFVSGVAKEILERSK